MSERLSTTCTGFSLQKVGGRCLKRDECRRYFYRPLEVGSPQDAFLCAVGKWDWFAPLLPEDKTDD